MTTSVQPQKDEIGFLKLDSNAIIPTRAYANDLGFDLYALEDVMMPFGPMAWQSPVIKIRTGVAVELPDDTGALIRDRSSVASNKGIFVVAGVIDPDYTGEIIVVFSLQSQRNRQPNTILFNAGEKIAQLVPVKSIPFTVKEINKITKQTLRGQNGFGSTGV